jgi:diacylglycerol diphosphate phosphatase/phosphatidate phosphatase
MGIFTRRPRNAPAAATTEKRRGQRRQVEPYTMATRPTFGQWLKVTWLDIITMVILGAVGLGVGISVKL